MNYPLYERGIFVERSLLEGELTPALAWCYDHASKLRRLANPLEFYLRTQEFVVLLLNGDKMAGLEFATEHLAPNAEIDPELVQQLMGLLAFPSPTQAPSEFSFLSLSPNVMWIMVFCIFLGCRGCCRRTGGWSLLCYSERLSWRCMAYNPQPPSLRSSRSLTIFIG